MRASFKMWNAASKCRAASRVGGLADHRHRAGTHVGFSSSLKNSQSKIMCSSLLWAHMMLVPFVEKMPAPGGVSHEHRSWSTKPCAFRSDELHGHKRGEIDRSGTSWGSTEA